MDPQERNNGNRPYDSKPLILVIENDPSVVQAIQSTLELLYDIELASDGREGVDKALLLHPDLIISGILIPKLSGDQVFHEIRNHSSSKDIPFMVLTAKTDMEFRMKLLDEGVSDYLLKPFSPQELKARVKNLFAIRSGETMFRALLSSAQDAILIADGEGKIIFANDQVSDWFGYPQKELVGQGVELLMPEHIRPEQVRLRKEYAKDPKRRALRRPAKELTGRKKDGREFPIEIGLSPFKTTDGLRVTAIIRDISESQRRESQIRYLATLSRMLSESLNYEDTLRRVAMLAVPEVADGCVIRILGTDGVLHVRLVEHRDPERRWTIESHIRNAEKNGITPTSVERVGYEKKSILLKGIEKRDPNGGLLTSSEIDDFNSIGTKTLAIMPLLFQGHIIGTLTFTSDLSERIFQESDLSFFESIATRVALSIENANLYQKAKREVKMREEIMGIVSHDLKNPLTAIDMAAHLLLKINLDNREEVFRTASRITLSTDKMRRLISDLLDFEKIRGGVLILDRDSTKVFDIVEPVAELFKEQANSKGIKMEIQLPEDLPEAYCDGGRIEQVLSNLISNSIKFTPPNGTITISANQSGQDLNICVSDTGPGIPPQDLPHIFDRFWQATETKTLGTGLGLSIAKGIVEAHHGAIWAESTLGKGTRMSFSIPLTQARSARSAA